MWRWAGVALAALMLAIVGTGLVISHAWGTELRDEARLLPGTVIAGVDVGLLDREEALTVAGEALAAVIDHPHVIHADGHEWTVDARQLQAATDVGDLVATALSASHDRSLVELAQLRWFGAQVELDLQATVTIPEDALEAWVGERAAEVDHRPVDATIGWEEGEVVVAASENGFEVDQVAAIELLRTSLLERRDDPLELPHTVLEPQVGNEVVAAARVGALAALDATLTREVTLSHADGRWTTTPAELAAVVDGDALVAAALHEARTGGDPSQVPVSLEVPDSAIDALVGEIAASLNIAAVNATVDWSSGTVRRRAGREGRALDRTAAAGDLRAALQGAASEVDLQVPTVRPARDVADLRDVLVVHQSRRVVELHRGDQVLRSWPVAVGTGGSPTPTGTFVVGAKRFEPTWVNPAPTRWGRDMPARIGPGPNNPLGLRALNWNRPGGGDTLIRFHGTPNEDSIGEAASNGCVRMFNSDVIELYDLVSSGTMIISRR